MSKLLENFMDKYLNIANKNNIIEITLLEYYSENISNTKIDIERFLKHIQTNFKTKYSISKDIIYKYDNNSIIISNNTNNFITTKTIENINDTFYGKKMNITFKQILSDNHLVSKNRYHDIISIELFTITLKYFDIFIKYNVNDKYGNVSIIIKKPHEKKNLLKSLKDILDY